MSRHRKACETCHKSDLALKVAYCSGCGMKHRVCPTCWPTFTTCNDDKCRAEAKKRMRDAFKGPTPIQGSPQAEKTPKSLP